MEEIDLIFAKQSVKDSMLADQMRRHHGFGDEKEGVTRMEQV